MHVYSSHAELRLWTDGCEPACGTGNPAPPRASSSLAPSSDPLKEDLCPECDARQCRSRAFWAEGLLCQVLR